MEFDQVFSLREYFPPVPVSDAPPTLRLELQWKHCQHVFQWTNHGFLFQYFVVDLTHDFSSSFFEFSLPPFAEYREDLWSSIASQGFPRSLSDSIYADLTHIFDGITGRRPGLFPSVVVVDISFIHRVFEFYNPQALAIILPPQPAEEWIIGDDGAEEVDVFSYDEEEVDVFSDDESIPGTPLEERGEFLTESEILGRLKRVKWATERGEETCSICLNEFSEGLEVMTMACQHSYHDQCLFSWLDRNQICPLCRRPS